LKGAEPLHFLEKIEPHLLSEDIHIKEFVLQVLRDFPNVPEVWTAKLIKRMVDSHSISLLMELKKHTLNEEAVRFLIEGAKAGLKVDVRLKAGDASSSLIKEPVEPDEKGEISLIIEEESYLDSAAYIVVLTESGQICAQMFTTIGE